MQLIREEVTMFTLRLTTEDAYDLKALLQNYSSEEPEENGLDIRSRIFEALPSFEELLLCK